MHNQLVNICGPTCGPTGIKCFETTILEITVVVFAYSFSGNAFLQDHPQHLFFIFKESGLPLYQTKYPGKCQKNMYHLYQQSGSH